jgi:chromosome segregation ATPase
MTMSQTKSIKIRLSPIMERMKGSLDKIRALEVTVDESRSAEEEKEQGWIRSHHPENDKARVHAKSRELLTHSMEMLHRKLERLSQMESDVDVAEDRRQELQHYFLQSSLNKPSRELATTRQRNKQLEDQVSQLEEEVHQLGRRCATIDRLQQQVDSFPEQLQTLESVQKELCESHTKCNLLENDLEQRQSKLREQSEQSDDLECKVKQLTTMSDDLLQTLAAREVQNEVLVRQLRNEQPEAFKRGNNKPDTTKSSSHASFSSTAQESDESSSLGSEAEPHSIGEVNPAHSVSSSPSEEGEETKSPKRFSRLQSLASAVLKGSATTKTDNASSSTYESVKGMSIVVQKTPLDSSFAMEKLEAVQSENTRLIQSQQDMKSKCVVLKKENTWQSSRIAQLERQLQATEQRLSMSSSSAPTMSLPRPETKGSFFRKFVLDSPSFDGSRQRGSVHRPSKAELVSQGLAVVSQGRSDTSNLLRPLEEPNLLEVAGTESPSVATQENANDAPSPPTTLLNETETLSLVVSV